MTSRTLFQSLLFRIVVGFGIGLLVVVFTQSFHLRFLRDFELATVDYRYQQRGIPKNLSEQGNVIIVDISDKDLAVLPDSYPFPRTYYAHVIENLNRAGVRTIVLDLTLDKPWSGDDSLRAVLARFDNVILAVKAPPQEFDGKYLVRSPERNYATMFYDVNRRVGAVNLPLDPDDVVRRYAPFVWSSGYLTPSLAFAALNHAYRLAADSVVTVSDGLFLFAGREIPSVDDEAFFLNYYGPAHTFLRVPFSQVIDDASFWTKDELDIEEQINTFDENLMRQFSNKVVIIASTMEEQRDSYTIPIVGSDGQRVMDGAEIHATAIQNVIDRSFVLKPRADLEILLVLLLSVVTFVSILAVRRVRFPSTLLLELSSVLVVLLLFAAVLALGVLEFNSQSLLIPTANPCLAILVAYGATIVYQYISRRQEKSLIKNFFTHYMSKEIVTTLVDNPALAKLEGDRRELTVLCADITDFSTISEPLPPEKLVQFLGEFRDEMSSVILKYGGTVDALAGDAIVAFWGAPLAQEDHSKRACLAALEMQARLEQIRPRWQRTGKPSVDLRIGIDTGMMIVGNMGGKDRFDYGAIGEAVNVAHRLQGANKEYRSRVIMSEATYAQVREAMITRDLDVLRVKGRPEPIHIWELLNSADSPLNDVQRQSLEAYQEGLRLYRERRWSEAIAYLQQAKSLDPTCFVAEVHEQRASVYRLNPPPPDWDGVFSAAVK